MCIRDRSGELSSALKGGATPNLGGTADELLSGAKATEPLKALPHPGKLRRRGALTPISKAG